MTQAPNNLQAVRITPGKNPQQHIRPHLARELNRTVWMRLCMLYGSDPSGTPNVFWVTPDPRTSSVYGLLVEIIGIRPEGERIEAMIEQIVHDVLSDGYDITVFFSAHPAPIPVN
jgi:hypothetical protein